MKNIFSSLFKKENSTSKATILEDTNYLEDSSQLVGYASIEEQLLSYKSLLTFFTPTESILDIGCGRGDLYAYLKQIHEDVFPDSNYTGIDTNSVLMDVGKEKYRLNNLINSNLNSFSIANKFDWVVASNYFNSLTPDNYQTLYNGIDKMVQLSNNAVAFNLITTQLDNTANLETQYYFYDSGKVLNHLLTTYKKVVVRADYLLGDITFFIFKN